MAPPPPIIIDAEAVSGITGSISIACWVIVFAPQIYENFRRKSSEGLSLSFVILWLAGDLFNVLGSVIQGVLPTMIILAIYYTFADLILLWQCLFYGHGSKKADLIHLSPANPFDGDVLETVLSRGREESVAAEEDESTITNDDDIENGSSSSLCDSLSAYGKPTTRWESFVNAMFKTLVVLSVIGAGLLGWYISYLNTEKHKRKHPHEHKPELVFDPLAQFFGWLCAILYLGSRIPQIVLNYERKSCEGISFMFFLFACLGNLTYVISILSIDTSINYLWVNSSWLAGSLGTLGLDFTIFVQFFLYNENYSDESESELNRLLNGSESSDNYGVIS